MNAELFKKIRIPCLLVVFTLISVIMIAESVRAALPAGRSVGIESDAEGLYLTLPGVDDATYDIDVKSSLTNTSWQRLGTLEAVDGENIYPIPASSEPSRVFRAHFPQPALAAAEPAFLSPSGDNTVYVSGQYFYEGDLIRVGGVLLSNVTFLSSTLLSGTLPAQAPGLYDVEVISGHNGALLATLHDAVQVSPPLELTLQEPPSTWPPAGPAASRKGYDYYKAQSDSSAAAMVSNPYFTDNTLNGTMAIAAASPVAAMSPCLKLIWMTMTTATEYPPWALQHLIHSVVMSRCLKRIWIPMTTATASRPRGYHPAPLRASP